MTGEPIDAIKSAESKSSAGEIVITARIARNLGTNEYILKMFPDGLHAKVKVVFNYFTNHYTRNQSQDF